MLPHDDHPPSAISQRARTRAPFARAAAACNVTQSTLSAGVKQLEGRLIAERGRRYVGLTEEGERVLADYSGLQQELSEMRDGMVGQLRIGAIPVPHTFLLLLGQTEGLTAIPLIEPGASHPIGLVASDRDPLPPVAQALLDLAHRLDIAAPVNRKVDRLWSAPDDRDRRSANP